MKKIILSLFFVAVIALDLSARKLVEAPGRPAYQVGGVHVLVIGGVQSVREQRAQRRLQRSPRRVSPNDSARVRLDFGSDNDDVAQQSSPNSRGLFGRAAALLQRRMAEGSAAQEEPQDVAVVGQARANGFDLIPIGRVADESEFDTEIGR